VEAIWAEAKSLIDHWAAPDGGFVVAGYADGAAIGVGERTRIAMLAAFLEVDPWRENVTGID
jgi:hypothetical protein